jgi:heme-degrading monooxygenase HmoA
MTFREDEIENFKRVFEDSKSAIRSFPGVQYLEMLQDVNNPATFFTYSNWESEVELENYRHSELFKNTWAKTKPLFDKPAEAWSSDRLHRLS